MSSVNSLASPHWSSTESDIGVADSRRPSPSTSRDPRVFTVLGGIAGALTWPVWGATWAAYHIAKKIVGIVWLYNFWKPKEGEYNFKARLLDTGFDLVSLVATPLFYLAVEFSFLRSIVQPRFGLPPLGSMLSSL